MAPKHARRPRRVASTPTSCIALPGLVLLLAAPTAAQIVPPLGVANGYRAEVIFAETGHPYGFGGFAGGAVADELFWSVDHVLWHRAQDGTVTVVRTAPPGTRFGLLVHPRGATDVYYADPATGELRVRDLGSGLERAAALPTNTFDLDLAPDGSIVVAANPNWPAPGSATGLFAVQTGGLAPRRIATLAGPSGPIAFLPDGDLIHAEQSAMYPTPPGSVRVLRFAASRVAAALAGGAPLTLADATLFATGLDGAFDLAVDDRGRIIVSDPQRGGLVELRADGSRAVPAPVQPGPFATLNLEFRDDGPATFDPYQPDDGATLLVATADWQQFAAVHSMRTARPTLGSSVGPVVPPAPFTVTADGLPPNQPAVLFLTYGPPVGPRIVAWSGGVPIWSAMNLSVPPIAVPMHADPDGVASLPLGYSGGLTWAMSFQVIGLDDPTLHPGLVATSSLLLLQLQP